jgi:hypothetical protein
MVLFLLVGCGMHQLPTTTSKEATQKTEPILISSQHRDQPIPDDQWNDETKLWLARSVLGEVGWLRPEEQSAVAWVYAIRAKQVKSYNFLGLVKRYSAAIRTTGKQRNPWLFELGFERARPDHWPSKIVWDGRYEQAWIDTLDLVDRWQAGDIPNYCPSANHFGSAFDRHRAESHRWMQVRCTNPTGSKRFRNYFYDSTRRHIGQYR